MNTRSRTALSAASGGKTTGELMTHSANAIINDDLECQSVDNDDATSGAAKKKKKGFFRKMAKVLNPFSSSKKNMIDAEDANSAALESIIDISSDIVSPSLIQTQGDPSETQEGACVITTGKLVVICTHFDISCIIY